jgi:pyruvate formate lyase activating enzyme
MKEAHKAGIANVLVSNGCVTSEAASEVLELCDAANIDLKCFSKETYSKIMGGDLIAVITFIREAIEKGVHLELTTLLVPGLNDSKAELDKCKDFIAELEVGGKAVPWHISAFHTNYKWSGAATKAESLLTAVEQAKEKLKFVYPGNIACDNNTPCPSCGQTLIDRRNYRVDISKLSLREENGKQVFFCASCGQKAPVYA